MTEPLFFDTDCISAFLWVDNESILSKLFPGRIIIPKEVYDELSHPGVNRVKGLKAQVDLMLQAGDRQHHPPLDSFRVWSENQSYGCSLPTSPSSINFWREPLHAPRHSEY